MSQSVDKMEKIVALCRRRGFIFGSSEIYGGIGGFWDYGPLGCELKKNIKDCWWNDMVRNPPPGPGGVEYQMVGVDCSIIMNPKVWEASGHVGGFSDPMVDCAFCKHRFRADQQPDELRSANWFLELTALWNEGNTSTPTEVVVKWVRSRAKKIASGLTPFFLSDPPVDAFCASLRKRDTLTFEEAFGKLKSFGKHLDEPEPFSPPPIELGRLMAMTCPECGGILSEPRSFNLMFQTYVGALQDSSAIAYLRPETAQGIFANFKNVMDSTRVKIPFGIAQVGKAFRNEINPRNYTFRSREFEQMEIEFFCKPDESMTWYEFWRDLRIKWYTSLGIKSDKLRPRQQDEKELAHYSKACTDIEYMFPFSDEPQELEGVAHRGSFDLNQHGKFSKNDENAFAVIDESSEPPASAGADSTRASGRGTQEGESARTEVRGSQKRERFVPHVIEPSAGADRFTLAVICEAYSFDESRASPEFMKFHPRLAPIKAAVFPLVAKDGLPEIAEPIFREIKKHYPCQYDEKQSIGKRYARMDEAGTPFCFTFDGQTKVDGTVTVRNRDDASQVRIDKSRCLEYLREQLRL